MLNPPDVLTKLASLRQADPEHALFGALSHRYALNEPLPSQIVSAFESDHRIMLPKDYRRFLIEVGNGGAGPFYGIFPLGRMDGGVGHERWHERDGFVGCLAEPFPHTAAWNLPAEELEPPESFASDADEEAWHAALERRYWRTDLVNGAIPICHHGCALRTWLVVTGPEAGNVWFDGRADRCGLWPHEGESGRLSFGPWYMSWLERSLSMAGSTP